MNCCVGAATEVVVRVLVRWPAGTNTVRLPPPRDVILVVLSPDVGPTGALVVSATDGGTD